MNRKSCGVLLFVTLLLATGSCKKEAAKSVGMHPIPIDADGNVYDTVRIGTQVWMKENLRTKHYQDGTPINEVEDSISWANIYNLQTKNAAWCDNGESPGNDSVYGKLYNYFAMCNSKNLCPVGWHVPDNLEWATLINHLTGSAWAGGPLKDTSSLWNAPNGGATDSTGFSALPGGCRNYIANFTPTGAYANFWTSSGSADYWNPSGSTTNAWSWCMDNNDPSMNLYFFDCNNGFSCRCVRDY